MSILDIFNSGEKDPAYHNNDSDFNFQFEQVVEIRDGIKKLQHEYDSTRGLWCIDRDPSEVDYEWIRQNAYQLKHTL